MPGDSSAELLLPRGEVPEGAAVGSQHELFVHLDSENRPVGTLKRPRLFLGEVAFLRITDTTRFGAFADWGLTKDLLVPFAEQTTEPKVGDVHPIALYLDKSDRLAGTMRVSEFLEIGNHDIQLDSWVTGEAWRRDPDRGIFVILERRYVGLLPASEPTTLGRGDRAEFRIANRLQDGKLELSQRGHAHEELDKDAARILEKLRAASPPRVGDNSPPEQIRELFGLSKKAFKRAAGRLLRERSVRLDIDGMLVAEPRPASAP